MNREQFISALDAAPSDEAVDELIEHGISTVYGPAFVLDIALWSLLESRNGRYEPQRVASIGTHLLGEFPRELCYVTALALLHQGYSHLNRNSELIGKVISILNQGSEAGDIHCYFALANMYLLAGTRDGYVDALLKGSRYGSYDCCMEVLLGDHAFNNEVLTNARTVAATLPNLTPDAFLPRPASSPHLHLHREFDHESGSFFVEYSPGRVPRSLCLHARRQARPLLKRSMVSSEDGKALVSSTRTSHGCFIPLRRMSISTIALDIILAEESGLPVSHGEQLHAIAYEAGDCFRPHRDPVYKEDGNESVACRSITVLLGASAAFGGGSTNFPKIDFRATLSCGDVLKFSNLTSDGLPHDLSLHAGEPVVSGEKWVFTKWMHTKPFN